MNKRVKLSNVILAIKPDGTSVAKNPNAHQAKARFMELVEATVGATGKYTYECVIWYGGGRLIRVSTQKGKPDSDGDGATDAEEIVAGTDPADPTNKP